MATRYFLKFDDVRAPIGGATQAGYTHWIEVDIGDWGFAAVTGSGRVGVVNVLGRPQIATFSTRDPIPLGAIAQAHSSGISYSSVIVEAVAEGRAFLRVVLSDVLITSFHSGGLDFRLVFSVGAARREIKRLGQAPATAVPLLDATIPPRGPSGTHPRHDR